MLELFLKRAARLSVRHPKRVLIAFVLVLIAAFLITGRLRFETDWLQLLPTDQGALKVLVEDLRGFGQLERLYILVEGDRKDTIIESAQGLRRSLAELEIGGSKAFTRVFSGIEADLAGWQELLDLYISHPQLYLNEDEAGEFTARLSDDKIREQIRTVKGLLISYLSPGWRDLVLTDPLALRELLLKRWQGKSPWAPSLAEGYLISPDGDTLLMVAEPAFPSADWRSSQELVQKLKPITKAFPQVRISFVGPHTMTVGKAGVLQKDLLVSFVGSFIMVLVLFYLAYRRWATLLFVGLPLLVGVQLTMGVAALFTSGLNLITVSFAAIIVGLGIDFAIHIYQRYHNERTAGRGMETALEIALTKTGKGVWTGGLTTIAAFLTLVLARVKGIMELGVLVAVGLVFCLLATSLVLPSFLVWMEGRGYRHRPLGGWGLERLINLLIAHYRTIIIVLISLAIAGAYLGARVKIMEGVEGFRPRGLEGVQTLERMQQEFGGVGKGITVLLEGADLDGLLQQQEAIAASLQDEYGEKILFFSHLAQFAPSTEGQQRVLAALRQGMDYERIARSLTTALKTEGLNPALFAQPRQMLRSLAHDQVLLAPTALLQQLASTPLAEIIERYAMKTEGGYRLRQEIRFDPTGVDPLRLQEAITRIAPQAQCTGNELIALELREMVKRDLTLLAPLALVLVLILLFWHFRNPLWVVMALSPLLVGVAYMLGISVLLGIEFNPTNAVAVPLIIGMGIDDGIHIVHRYRERKDVASAVRFTGKAVIMTSLTTMAGFGSLSTSHFPALSSLGKLVIIGMGSCLLTSLVLLPSLMVAVGGKTGQKKKGSLKKE